MLKLRLRNQCHSEVARVLPIVGTQWKCIAEGVLGVLECESMMRQSQSVTEAMEVLHKILTRAGCWTQGMSMGVAHARNLWELQKKSNNDSNENYQVPVLPFDSISGSSAHRNLTQSPNGFWNVQIHSRHQNYMATAVQTEYSRDSLKIRGCYQRTPICCCPSPRHHEKILSFRNQPPCTGK